MRAVDEEISEEGESMLCTIHRRQLDEWVHLPRKLELIIQCFKSKSIRSGKKFFTLLYGIIQNFCEKRFHSCLPLKY